MGLLHWNLWPCRLKPSCLHLHFHCQLSSTQRPGVGAELVCLTFLQWHLPLKQESGARINLHLWGRPEMSLEVSVFSFQNICDSSFISLLTCLILLSTLTWSRSEVIWSYRWKPNIARHRCFRIKRIKYGNYLWLLLWRIQSKGYFYPPINPWINSLFIN